MHLDISVIEQQSFHLVLPCYFGLSRWQDFPLFYPKMETLAWDAKQSFRTHSWLNANWTKKWKDLCLFVSLFACFSVFVVVVFFMCLCVLLCWFCFVWYFSSIAVFALLVQVHFNLWYKAWSLESTTSRGNKGQRSASKLSILQAQLIHCREKKNMNTCTLYN